MKIDHTQVAVVLYDDLRPHCNDIRANLTDFTRFKLNGKHQLDIYETTTVSKTLAELDTTKYKWAVVIAVGTFMRSQYLIFQTIEYAIAHNAVLAGHLLQKGGYYNFHQQYFAICLEAYHAIGSPALEEHSGPKDILVRDTLRSTENVHDDYTPVWLTAVLPGKPGLQNVKVDHVWFGTEALAQLIIAGYTVRNIPDRVRSAKSYAYPDFSDSEIRKLIADPAYEITDKNSGLWWFNHELQALTNNLNQGYYVLNTEIMAYDDKLDTMQFDCFVGVCGGLKSVVISGDGNFSDTTRVVLFDISQAAIDWQKYLYTNWDGDFDQFESKFREFQTQHSNYRPLYYAGHSIPDNIAGFLSNTGIDKSEFQRRWQRYCNYNIQFVKLDLLEDRAVMRLADYANLGSTGAYIWTSNCFYMDYLMFFKTEAWTRRMNRLFEQGLSEQVFLPTVLENCGQLTYM